MLVFVDESGDAGMKLGRGSSDYFVVTAVLFEDRDEANQCDAQIDLIRRHLHLPEHFEFHFNKCSKAIRRQFLTEVAPFGFIYLAVAINKPRLCETGFQFKEPLIEYASGLLFGSAKPHLREAIVVIDSSGSRDFRNHLATFLKQWSKANSRGNRLIRKVKTSRSSSNNLVQLADMVSGAIWRSLKHQDSSMRHEIAQREAGVQVWPE